MKRKSEQHFIAFKFAVLTACGLVLLFLVSQKIVLGNSVTYYNDFSQEIGLIYGPFPHERAENIDEVMKINHEPVYFNVYSPREFKSALVTITYQKPEKLELKLGSVINIKNWAFDMQNLETVNNSFHTQSLGFDLNNVEKINNTIRFVLSAPGLGEFEGPVLVDSFQITLYK